jgi:hypothetical protein
MKNKKLDVVECPHCGAEYLPCEIFIPKAFFGKYKNIIRDENNKIEEVIGYAENLEEIYNCDYCKQTFKVTAKVNYKSDKASNLDFDTDYSQPIYSQLTLFEN